MWLRIGIGAVIGAAVGGAIGWFGKCRSGVCPLTASPWTGAFFGLLVGGVIALSTRGPTQSAAYDAIPGVAGTEEFDQTVLRSPRPVLVDFYADACPPCRALAPVIGGLSAEYAGRADFVKVDVEQARALARRHIDGRIPTVLLFVGGEEVGRWVGSRGADTYRAALDAALARDG